MNNKILFFLTTLFFCICISSICAQNSTLVFDENFELDESSKNTEIDFGKKITLKGITGNNQVDSIKIKYKSYTSEGVAVATIKDKNWTALVGPFYPNDELSLTFEVIESLTNEKKDSLIKIVRKQIEILSDTLFSSNIDDTPEEFKARIEKLWLTDKNRLKKYTTILGKTLDSYISDLLAQDNQKILNLKEVIKSEQETLNPLIKQINSKVRLLNLVNDTVLRNTILENLKDNKAINTVSAFKVVTDLVLQNIITRYNETLEQLSINNKDYEKILNDIVKSAIGEVNVYTTNNILSEVIDISNFRNYIDLDVGASYVYIKKESQFGLMFLINMYCKKVDMEKHPTKWSERLSLTTGLGYTPFDSLSKTPIYFLGIGVRPNPVWKANIGTSFFRRAGKQDYNWNLTFGLSLSIKYITQLRKNYILPFNKNDN